MENSEKSSECRGCGNGCDKGSGGGCHSETVPPGAHLPASGAIKRADFMQLACGTVAVCWGGMALYPIVSYLDPPRGDEEQKSKISSMEVCKLAELPKGTGKNFRFGSFPALLIHTDDGELHAFKAICTHLGCTVQYREEMHRIYCACHGGEYDAATGKNIAGPPPKPLMALKAEVVDGKIIVSRV